MSNVDQRPLAPALSYQPGPSILVCADKAASRDRIRTVVEALGGRVTGTLPIVGAADRIGDMLPPDLVAVDIGMDAGDALDALLDRLNRAVQAGHYACLVNCAPELIDVVAARAPDVAMTSGAGLAEYAGALAMALERPVVTLREGEGETPLQLRQLSEEVGRIARALAQLSQAEPSPEAAFRPDPGSPAIEAGADMPSVASVRAVIRARRLRDQYFAPDLFADPAWDMLLDLLLARMEGRMVAVSSLCIAAAVPPTTALRWIKRLTDEGLFVRAADPRDGRRVFIDLAENTAQSLISYLRALGKLGVTIG